MAITMYQADRNFVSPANDASLYSGLVGDQDGILNRGSKFSISIKGLTATIGTGQAVIRGRLVEVTSPESLTIPPNASGKICIVVDLTKSNTVAGTAGQSDYAVAVNQAYIATVQGSVTQDDLNGGGFIYELPIASFASTATTATVKVLNSTFNDTGYITVPPVSGTTGNIQYRIVSGIITIYLKGVNASNSTNKNQIALLPVFPKQFVLGHIFQPSGSGINYWGSGVLQIQSNGLLYVLYDPKNTGLLTNMWGSISGPIN